MNSLLIMNKCGSARCVGGGYQSTPFRKLGKDENIIDDMCDKCISYYTPECDFCKQIGFDGDICMFCSKSYCGQCARKWDEVLGNESCVYGDHNLCIDCHN